MKRVLILSAAVLFCGVPLRAQVTKQVEVTKVYVPEVSKAVKLPIVVHTHCTTGLGPMTYLKAIEAGATTIDCAIACMSGGTSQPPTESMNYTLKQFGYDAGLNEDVLKEINDFFRPIRNKALETGLLNPVVMGTDPDSLTYQVPGGMLSNLIAQLKAQNALDRLQEVLEETPRVRADLGYPPLVTPSSQMVGVQAVQNVLAGERYKNVSKEIKAYCRGEYGHTPAPIDPAIQKKILGEEKPLTGRYADTLPPIFEKTKRELKGIARCDEDVLSYIAFPQLAEKFFEERKAKEENEATYTIEAI